jgi:hypothetical protein
MNLLRKLGKTAWRIVQAWGIFVSVLSVGYVFNNHITGEKDPIQLTFGYFSYIFIEGAAPCTIVVILLYELKEWCERK